MLNALRALAARIPLPNQLPPGPYYGVLAQFGYNIQVVPEPGTFALAGLAISALLIVRRRK